MDFYSRVGKMALGSRLRKLSDRVTEDAAAIYAMYGVELQPRWFPVYYLLSEQGEMPVTAIAMNIGHSHVSVSQIVKEMVRAGIVTEKRDKNDGRKTLVSLSKKGQTISGKIEEQYIDVTAAVESLFAEATYDLWKAMDEVDHLLDKKSLLKRVEEQKKGRMSQGITLVSYTKKYQYAFKQLNEEWIQTYFRMEEADYKALDNPQAYILKNGGYIVMALDGKNAVGTCALIKHDNATYELAKMAVSPLAQGKGVGFLLGQHIIEKAKDLGASKIFLESNTILKPAINLYYKLGFVKITGRPSPYERSNIQMELNLK
jgi:GNAT superfamily N-acetyltransferase/predicted transcriptional regulator